MSGDSRARMIASAAALIGSRGLSGTALSDVVADSEHSPAGDAGAARDDAGGDLIDAARDAFAAWTDALAERLRATGVPAERAGPVALATLAAMEGRSSCAAQRSAAPLEAIARELPRLLAPAPAGEAS